MYGPLACSLVWFQGIHFVLGSNATASRRQSSVVLRPRIAAGEGKKFCLIEAQDLGVRLFGYNIS